MASVRDELQARLAQLPTPPFFARLRDPRQHLSALQLARCPYLQRQRAFVVAELVLDRCFEQPGLWVRAVDTSQERFSDGQFKKQRDPVWLNLDWCDVIDGPNGELNFLKPN